MFYAVALYNYIGIGDLTALFILLIINMLFCDFDITLFK